MLISTEGNITVTVRVLQSLSPLAQLTDGNLPHFMQGKKMSAAILKRRIWKLHIAHVSGLKGYSIAFYLLFS
jgi:hypothetical protein